MAEWTLRECRTCGLEKPCPPNRRQCRDCNSAQHLEWSHRTGKHRPGRQAYYRQHAEIRGAKEGATSWVSCRKCGLMKLYRLRSDGKGGKGWKRLACPDCSNAAAREYTAKRKAEGVRSGLCSKCHQEKPYHNGRQCRECFNAQRNAYRRATGKGKRQPMPTYTPGREPFKRCSGCRKSKLHTGQWSANQCPACVKASNKKSRAALRQRMIEAGEWECVTCHQVQTVEDGARGWMSAKCPECTREMDRARKRRKRESSPKTAPMVAQQGKTAKGPGNAPQGAHTGIPELTAAQRRQARNAEMVTPAQQGQTTADIAERYDLTTLTVNGVLKKAGTVAKRRTKRDEELWRRIAELRRQGLTYRAICARTGRGMGYVTNVLHQMGLTTQRRPKTGAVIPSKIGESADSPDS